MRTLAEPAPDPARTAIRAGFDAGHLVTVAGRCTVDFDGRTSGHLGAGDRLVVCKPDGALLVHGPAGHAPEAWLPPDADRTAACADGELRISGERTDGDDAVVVQFESVAHVTAAPASETPEREVSGTEADLRERVLSEPSLVEPGFTPLATERETGAGAVDVYGEDDAGNPVAVELKRRRAGPAAVSQLGRYVDALGDDLHADASVRGVLVSPSATERARRLLSDRGFSFVPLEP